MLDIGGWSTDKIYYGGNMGLHLIRWLALLVAGWPCTYEEFDEIENKGIWNKTTRFYQLFHFSDSEGIFVPDFYLLKVDYKNSFHLGNSIKLLDELEIIKLEIEREDWIKEQVKGTRALESFNELYQLVYDEVKNGKGILIFY